LNLENGPADERAESGRGWPHFGPDGQRAAFSHVLPPITRPLYGRFGIKKSCPDCFRAAQTCPHISCGLRKKNLGAKSVFSRKVREKDEKDFFFQKRPFCFD
jgi:hypothetical protein